MYWQYLPMVLSLLSSMFGGGKGGSAPLGMPQSETGGNLAKIQQTVAPQNQTLSLLPSGQVTAAQPTPPPTWNSFSDYFGF